MNNKHRYPVTFEISYPIVDLCSKFVIIHLAIYIPIFLIKVSGKWIDKMLGVASNK